MLAARRFEQGEMSPARLTAGGSSGRKAPAPLRGYAPRRAARGFIRIQPKIRRFPRRAGCFAGPCLARALQMLLIFVFEIGAAAAP